MNINEMARVSHQRIVLKLLKPAYSYCAPKEVQVNVSFD